MTAFFNLLGKSKPAKLTSFRRRAPNAAGGLFCGARMTCPTHLHGWVSIHPYIHPVNSSVGHISRLVCQTTFKSTNIHRTCASFFQDLEIDPLYCMLLGAESLSKFISWRKRRLTKHNSICRGKSKFKSWMRFFTFHFVPMRLGKAWIHLFPLQLGKKSRWDLAIYSLNSNYFRRKLWIQISCTCLKKLTSCHLLPVAEGLGKYIPWKMKLILTCV